MYLYQRLGHLLLRIQLELKVRLVRPRERPLRCLGIILRLRIWPERQLPRSEPPGSRRMRPPSPKVHIKPPPIRIAAPSELNVRPCIPAPDRHAATRSAILN